MVPRETPANQSKGVVTMAGNPLRVPPLSCLGMLVTTAMYFELQCISILHTHHLTPFSLSPWGAYYHPKFQRRKLWFGSTGQVTSPQGGRARWWQGLVSPDLTNFSVMSALYPSRVNLVPRPPGRVPHRRVSVSPRPRLHS